MYYGQHVAKTFGLTEATRVLLQYEIVNNMFAMTILPNVVANSNEDEVIELLTSDNESDNGTEVIEIDDYEDQSDLDTEEEINEPDEILETHSWRKKVTKALASTGKAQVLHLPNAISRTVLANTTEVRLISEDMPFEMQCTIHSSRRSAQFGNYEKHIGTGWYEYKEQHNPRAGNILEFQFIQPTSELHVKLLR
ncbi:hypothetical protein TSUD_131900 [Trifolium subterraneum]|uniref:TF-B3 domain-containing protein n=1 Tax=Trifolium subterraneum TaxID=3900 RepID=A0A2Z6LV19_TRISU|nr:hypothetical protein TSUD_131900 [Trifolium subterraneum]